MTERRRHEPATGRRPVDLLVRADHVVTMDGERRVITDGAVAVTGGRIVDVGPAPDVLRRCEPAAELGGPGHLAIPGLVDAHQHLTGDRLVRSTIPDDLPSHRAIGEWAIPVHAAHTPDDDELSATLALVEAVTNGITFVVEAGTVAHPERVLAAFDTVGVGGALGTWGWDVGDGPYRAPTDAVLDRQRAVLELTADHPSVTGWITLVGHDLMSDALVTAASDLARSHGTTLSFHMSPTPADAGAYLARTGRRPFAHLAALGALGPHVLAAHAVHLDDTEVETILDHDVALASCPWAYLRLGQGYTGAGRHVDLHRRGARLALGCDSENAGDAIDVLRAGALWAGLAKDVAHDASAPGAHDAMTLATIGGARAVGRAGELGSLEVGKRADVVLVDVAGPAWIPRSDDPVLQLVWGSGGRDVRHVVAGGRVVVRDGRCTTVDLVQLAERATEARRRLRPSGPPVG